MSLPKVRKETWKRICPEEIFCMRGPSHKFMRDRMAELKNTNPHLHALLYDILNGDKKGFVLTKNVGFDAVLAATAVSALLAAETTLPVISKEVIDKTVADFRKDPLAFCAEMDNREVGVTLNPYIAMAICVCYGNYEMQGYEQEALFIKAAAFMVYKMFEQQFGLEPVR
jgi:hypothetical protein